MPRLDSYNVSAGEVIVRNRKQNLQDIWLKTNLFGLNWAKGDSEETARCFSKLTRSLPELGQLNERKQNAEHVRATCSLSFACRIDGQRLTLLKLLLQLGRVAKYHS